VEGFDLPSVKRDNGVPTVFSGEVGRTCSIAVLGIFSSERNACPRRLGDDPDIAAGFQYLRRHPVFLH